MREEKRTFRALASLACVLQSSIVAYKKTQDCQVQNPHQQKILKSVTERFFFNQKIWLFFILLSVLLGLISCLEFEPFKSFEQQFLSFNIAGIHSKQFRM